MGVPTPTPSKPPNPPYPSSPASPSSANQHSRPAIFFCPSPLPFSTGRRNRFRLAGSAAQMGSAAIVLFWGQDYTHSNRGLFWHRSVVFLFLSLSSLSLPVSFPSAAFPPFRLRSSAVVPLSITITSLCPPLFYSTSCTTPLLQRSTLAFALIFVFLFLASQPDGPKTRQVRDTYLVDVPQTCVGTIRPTKVSSNPPPNTR